MGPAGHPLGAASERGPLGSGIGHGVGAGSWDGWAGSAAAAGLQPIKARGARGGWQAGAAGPK